MEESPAKKETPSGFSAISEPPAGAIISNEHLFKDALYYLDFVQFEMENTVVRVPRYHFTNPPGSQQNHDAPLREGPDEEVIQLSDVRLEDFHQLLTILYPLNQTEGPKTSDNWISVLYLSTRYQLFKIRQLAITALGKYKLSSIKRILLARQFGLEDWLTREYLNLAKRQESISFKGAQSLGLSATIKLYQIREYALRSTKPKPVPAPQPQRQPQPVSALKHGGATSSLVLTFATDPKPAVSSFRPELPPPNSLPAPASQLLSEKERYLETISHVFSQEFASTNVVVTDTIERAVLARSLGIIQWLRDAYLELARRHEGLSEGEAARLGLEASVGIYRVREKALFGGDGAGRLLREEEYEKLVKTKFELELGDVGRHGALYSGLARSWGVVVVDGEMEGEEGEEK